MAKVRIEIDGPLVGTGTPPKFSTRVTDESGAIILHMMGTAELVSGTLEAWLRSIYRPRPASRKDETMPVNVCDRCGYAHVIKKVLLMVEGRPMNEHKMCADCLLRVFDALQARVKV